MKKEDSEEKEEKKIHIGDLIKQKFEEIKKEGDVKKNYKWLADKMFYSLSGLNHIFERNSINTETLERFCNVLECNFFAFYSHLYEKFDKEKRIGSINFCRLEHYPLGHANVVLTENRTLEISNFETPLDGILIRTNGACEWMLAINPVQIERGDVFGVTYNFTDNLNRVKTIAQWSLQQSPDGKYVYLVVNSKLEGDIITVRGTKDGKEVFMREYSKNDNPDNAWICVLALRIMILNSIDYESATEIITHPDGVQTKVETITKSIGNRGQAHAIPVVQLSPIKPVLEDNTYMIDHIYISSARSYPAQFSDELDGKISEVIFTAKTTKSIEINNEIYSIKKTDESIDI
jgi:DNA-binding Xre family transcriptional regulator